MWFEDPKPLSCQNFPMDYLRRDKQRETRATRQKQPTKEKIYIKEPDDIFDFWILLLLPVSFEVGRHCARIKTFQVFVTVRCVLWKVCFCMLSLFYYESTRSDSELKKIHQTKDNFGSRLLDNVESIGSTPLEKHLVTIQLEHWFLNFPWVGRNGLGAFALQPFCVVAS